MDDMTQTITRVFLGRKQVHCQLLNCAWGLADSKLIGDRAILVVFPKGPGRTWCSFLEVASSSSSSFAAAAFSFWTFRSWFQPTVGFHRLVRLPRGAPKKWRDSCCAPTQYQPIPPRKTVGNQPAGGIWIEGTPVCLLNPSGQVGYVAMTFNDRHDRWLPEYNKGECCFQTIPLGSNVWCVDLKLVHSTLDTIDYTTVVCTVSWHCCRLMKREQADIWWTNSS